MDWGKLLLPRWGSLGRKQKGARAKLNIEKRRSERMPVAMPVFVYGRAQGMPFSEHTETANVSAHGGLIPLSTEIESSQTLLVTNLQTNEDLACRVARLVKLEAGRTLVGIEFLRPSPRFWTIDFSAGPPR
jgi:PilZ domain-containing protein